MSGELFDVPETKSPKLKWLEQHKIKTEQTQYKVGDEDEFGEDLFPWYAWTGGANIARTSTSKMAGGETEDEAIRNLAIKLHLRTWGEENL